MRLAEGDLLAIKSVDVVEAIEQEDGKRWIVGTYKKERRPRLWKIERRRDSQICRTIELLRTINVLA